MVAPAGIEPARPYGLQILSLLRLPVSPRGHVRIMVGMFLCGNDAIFKRLIHFFPKEP